MGQPGTGLRAEVSCACCGSRSPSGLGHPTTLRDAQAIIAAVRWMPPGRDWLAWSTPDAVCERTQTSALVHELLENLPRKDRVAAYQQLRELYPNGAFEGVAVPTAVRTGRHTVKVAPIHIGQPWPPMLTWVVSEESSDSRTWTSFATGDLEVSVHEQLVDLLRRHPDRMTDLLRWHPLAASTSMSEVRAYLGVLTDLLDQ